MEKIEAKKVYYYERDNLYTQAGLARYNFALSYVKNKIAADIGCGARKGPCFLSKKASKVFAVDISQQAVSFAAANWPAENIYYAVSDAASIALKRDVFDCVVSFEVIEHIDNFKKYLEEIARILKPSGEFILSTPNRLVTGKNAALSNPDHFREFDREELDSALKRYFSEVSIYGQFVSPRVFRLEKSWQGEYERVSKTPKFIKQVIPAKIKELALTKYLSLTTKFRTNLDKKQIGEDDFPIERENLDLCRYFIGVCKK
ncbi:MAG: class I SAM-dependent methyltransferase [Candidatus Omnitrophica bacterium]|nr:class I SAM-dependent methyltransferase [Candidatus Omnitrophota bacterium]